MGHIRLFCVLLVINAEPTAKGNRVTIHVTNASLLQIFNQIEKQTTYHFSYLDSEIDNRSDISMNVSNASVSSVLDRALKGRSLTYKIVSSKSIVISKVKAFPSVHKSSTVGSGQSTRSSVVVRGTVKDAKGEPVIGATVRPRGSKGGTVTDIDGHFEVEAPANGVLEFSYIGYKTQMVNVGGKRQLAVTMEENVNDLNETVVVGYGTMKKRDLTGSITSIKGDKMTDVTVPQPLMALQGKAAGVQVTQNTGDPSGNFKIRIRGNNSIMGNNDPLILVDGIPAYASSVDPYDIESVEVLKDASATAIYGSRGANGVVLITSKSGKKGKTSIQYDGSIGVQSRIGHYDLMNAQEYAKYINIWQTNDVGKPYFTDDQINAMGEGYDWQDAIFHDAMETQHHLSVSGGNDRTQAMISGSIYDRDGLVKESNYRKINIRSNVTENLSDHFIATMNFAYTNAHSSLPQRLTGTSADNSIIRFSYAAPPSLTPYNDDGSYRNFLLDYPFFSAVQINPLNYLYETSQNHKEEVLEINGSLAYKPIKGLTLKTSLALQSINTAISRQRLLLGESAKRSL
jgi:TonB-linked SusC/RagA family outer membrane protein